MGECTWSQVPYFHLRVCNKPKYYFDNELSKE